MDFSEIVKRMPAVIAGLNEAQQEYLDARGYKNPVPNWVWLEKKRYIYIDSDGGGHGAFLVDKETGELYNIKAYGVPDHNKKFKSDIGNILTVNPKRLYSMRFNYLR